MQAAVPCLASGGGERTAACRPPGRRASWAIRTAIVRDEPGPAGTAVTPRWDCRARRTWARGVTKVRQDLVDHRGLGDEPEDLPGPATRRRRERVDLVRFIQQHQQPHPTRHRRRRRTGAVALWRCDATTDCSKCRPRPPMNHAGWSWDAVLVSPGRRWSRYVTTAFVEYRCAVRALRRWRCVDVPPISGPIVM